MQTRQAEFFEYWYRAVKRFTNPQQILIVDSHSPVKPNLEGKEDCQLVSMVKNFGAAIDGSSKSMLSGWDRGIIAGAAYAMVNDVDYFVYVEQDCLIYGDGIIEHAIASMPANKPISLGSGEGTPQRAQQSLVIIRRDFIPTFLYIENTQSKAALKNAPELRYFESYRAINHWLPFRGGRQRPVDWDADYIYLQHMSSEELDRFKAIIGEDDPN